MKRTTARLNPYLAGAVAVGCLLALFWRLDGANLWRDEATTATWASTMAQTGSLAPYVFDGKTLAVQGFDAHDFNEHLTPGMQGWLQFYVAAISFKLFGVSTLTARLPFAIVGLLSCGVMWLIGRRLYPSGNLALLFPLLTASSIWFLTAVRQCRYYGLVFLFGALLLLEILRYLQDRDVVGRWSWYFRISAWSAGVYLSNYLGFAGLYAALCLFVLLMRDRPLLLRWSAMTAVLAVLFGAEFFSFHFDFASSWGASAQPWENADSSIWDKLRIARGMHSEENFRMLPLLFLIPGVFFLFRSTAAPEGARSREGVPTWALAAPWALAIIAFFAKGTESFTWLAIGMTFLLSALGLLRFRAVRGRGGSGLQNSMADWLLPAALGGMVVYGIGVSYTEPSLILHTFAEVLVAGLTVYAVIRLRPRPGHPMDVTRGMLLLTILVIVISIAVTIGVGLDKGLVRYYYQVLASAILLAGLVAAEFFRRGHRTAALALLAGFLIWPDITWHFNSSFGIFARQVTENRTIDHPVVDFLRSNAKPGDRFVVFRNVQGMMLHFYLPELFWVGQLDATNERAMHFRGRLPETAYDTVPDVDWYCVWDNYGTMPKGLDDRYEKVWDYTYRYPMPWWDLKAGVKDERRWRIYRRKPSTIEPGARDSNSASDTGV